VLFTSRTITVIISVGPEGSEGGGEEGVGGEKGRVERRVVPRWRGGEGGLNQTHSRH